MGQRNTPSIASPLPAENRADWKRSVSSNGTRKSESSLCPEGYRPERAGKEEGSLGGLVTRFSGAGPAHE